MIAQLRKLSLILIFIGVSLFVYSMSVRAATCSITGAMTLDQAYVDANSCDIINVSGTFTLTISGTIDLVGSGSLNVTSGTVTFSGPLVLGATDDFSVSLGATVTHAQGDVAGVQITARNVTIDGAINTVAKGCQGGTPAAKNGYGPHLGTGVCTVSTSGFGIPNRGGASHAGTGGNANSSLNTQGLRYGNALAPTLLGSGGAGGPNAGENGGFGGGRVYIDSTGILAIAGTVSANGDNSAATLFGSGGGSGGSIYLKAATLSGVGSVTANGGDGRSWSGGGGGGRVAVYYDASTFTFSNITTTFGAKGATGTAGNGANGSTFILDRLTDDGLGTLTITSGLDFTSGTDYVRDNITVYDGSLLKCDSFATLNIGASATVDFRGVTFSCDTVDAVNFSANTWITSNTNTMSFAKAGAQVNWDIANNLTLNNLTYTGGIGGTSSANGGVLSFNNAITVSLVNTDLNTSVNWDGVGDITLDADSSINATGKGCQGGTSSAQNGYGPHLDTGVCTVSTSGYGIAARGAAAHAGAGGRSHHTNNPQTTTYGVQNTPTLFGSGGAAGGNAGELGGAGGGKVYINSTGSLSIAGSVASNGAPGNLVSFGAGGGSGGSVYLVATAFSGNGSLSANGGNAGQAGGGGGAGRIAVHYGSQSGTLFSNMTVSGGLKNDAVTSSTSGSSGTTATIQLPVLDSLVITDNSGYTNSATPVITLSKSGATPTHVAFSCNGGSNWSDWITYPDDDVVNDGDGPAFNITSGVTGCSATNELKTISAKIKDDNSESGTASDTTTYDTIAPTVVGVSATNVNGTYGADTVLTLTVQFSDTTMTVTGAPRLELDMDGADRQATYSSTATDTLSFTYTVVVGDNKTNLDYTSANALTLNSGTIQDLAGNTATLTLPSPGASGSLSANKTIHVVTNQAPVVNSVSGTQLTDGTGVVSWTMQVDDDDNDDTLRLKLEYSLNSGSNWSSATLKTDPSTVSATFGAPGINNAVEYQVGQAGSYISTSSGANTITVRWDASVDVPSSTDTAGLLLRVTPYDGATVGTPRVSSAVTLDLVAPTGLGTLSHAMYETVQWSAVTDSNFAQYQVWYSYDESDATNATGTALVWNSGNDAQLTTAGTTSTTITGGLRMRYVMVRAIDAFGNTAQASTFYITGSGPVSEPEVIPSTAPTQTIYDLALTYPVAGQTVEVNEPFSILFASTGLSTIWSVDISLSRNGSTFAPLALAVPVSQGGYTWTPSSADAGSVLSFKVTARDPANSAVYDTVENVSVSTIDLPPEAETPSDENSIGTFDQPFTSALDVSVHAYIRGIDFNTVYYIDPSRVRRPFADAQTYFTYESNFSRVQFVTDIILREWAMGKPMQPEWGVVLVKVQSVPKVYAIDEDGRFRWIANEDVAIDLYGQDWSDYVIDMPVTMWGHVEFGEDVYSKDDLTIDPERQKKRDQLYAK